MAQRMRWLPSVHWLPPLWLPQDKCLRMRGGSKYRGLFPGGRMYPGQVSTIPLLLWLRSVSILVYFLRLFFTCIRFLFLHLQLWPKQFPMLLKVHLLTTFIMLSLAQWTLPTDSIDIDTGSRQSCRVWKLHITLGMVLGGGSFLGGVLLLLPLLQASLKPFSEVASGVWFVREENEEREGSNFVAAFGPICPISTTYQHVLPHDLRNFPAWVKRPNCEKK